MNEVRLRPTKDNKVLNLLNTTNNTSIVVYVEEVNSTMMRLIEETIT